MTINRNTTPQTQNIINICINFFVLFFIISFFTTNWLGNKDNDICKHLRQNSKTKSNKQVEHNFKKQLKRAEYKLNYFINLQW